MRFTYLETHLVFLRVLITRTTTISRNGDLAFLRVLPCTPPDPKSRAKVPRSFPRSILFHSHVYRRRCPCTMVHVISGEWSSPDAYTNSFSVPPFHPPATLRGVCPPPFRARPCRIPFNVFLSFLRFSSDFARDDHNDVGDSSLFHATVKATQKP